jgi:hypothetical protein
MKRFLYGAFAALSLTLLASPARADCSLDYSCCRSLCFKHTSKNRCFSYSSHSNPLPCAGGYAPAGPVAWNGLAAYGYPGYGYAAPVAAAPAAAAPAATTPGYKAPAPTPTTNSGNGVQQTGYSYYGQPAAPSYGSSSGYYYYGANYGYGSYGYAQAPNYWY